MHQEKKRNPKSAGKGSYLKKYVWRFQVSTTLRIRQGRQGPRQFRDRPRSDRRSPP